MPTPGPPQQAVELLTPRPMPKAKLTNPTLGPPEIETGLPRNNLALVAVVVFLALVAVVVFEQFARRDSTVPQAEEIDIVGRQNSTYQPPTLE